LNQGFNRAGTRRNIVPVDFGSHCGVPAKGGKQRAKDGIQRKRKTHQDNNEAGVVLADMTNYRIGPTSDHTGSELSTCMALEMNA